MFSGKFCEKCKLVRERNLKLLLEAVMYMATTETTTHVITIEIVVQKCTVENTTCMIATDSYLQ